MPKLPQVSGGEVIKALRKIGFEKVSQKGSHIKLQRLKTNLTQTIIVPDHKVLKKGTLQNGILKNIPLTVEEFLSLLKKRK
ncbi:MAG: YcfA family protein [Candidatus Woesebacteria bacterium GW2011_GWB1_38_8]|uniref:YcfA family protein n=1 Tax=Candidatus Woesebacteria bacterium GW2011_GWB1_38_8 TaxID=1618570 RepID=A0A0G0L094_9BACT|nr:MAG: YcfA family protein [Candidatus Woesebacteria bacterium GW2011_GWB1_38_8]